MIEDFSQYLSFQDNPLSLAIGVFIILFAVAFILLGKAFKNNKGAAIVVSLILAIVSSYNLFKERFNISFDRWIFTSRKII